MKVAGDKSSTNNIQEFDLMTLIAQKTKDLRWWINCYQAVALNTLFWVYVMDYFASWKFLRHWVKDWLKDISYLA